MHQITASLNSSYSLYFYETALFFLILFIFCIHFRKLDLTLRLRLLSNAEHFDCLATFFHVMQCVLLSILTIMLALSHCPVSVEIYLNLFVIQHCWGIVGAILTRNCNSWDAKFGVACVMEKKYILYCILLYNKYKVTRNI